MSETLTVRPGGLGSMMAGGNPDPARGRSQDDFYPTPVEVTEALMRRWGKVIPPMPIWEPCAGNGVMLDVIQRHLPDASVLGTDIEPRRADIRPLDILATRGDGGRFGAVITNPPFALAEPIIRHVFKLAPDLPFMALVLKASYWHSSRRHALFQRHPPEVVHPLLWRPDFQGLGRPTMEIMWCVWRKPTDGMTTYEPLPRP